MRELERNARTDTEMGLFLTRLNDTNPSRQVIRGGGSALTSGNHQDPQILRSQIPALLPKFSFPIHPFLLHPYSCFQDGPSSFLFFSHIYCIYKTKLTASKTFPCIFVHFDSCFHNCESQKSLLEWWSFGREKGWAVLIWLKIARKGPKLFWQSIGDYTTWQTILEMDIIISIYTLN